MSRPVAKQAGLSSESPRAARKRLARLWTRPATGHALPWHHVDDDGNGVFVFADTHREKMAKRLARRERDNGRWRDLRGAMAKPAPTTETRLKMAAAWREAQLRMTARESLAQAYSNRPKRARPKAKTA